MSEENPTRNNLGALPNPTKTLQPHETLRGLLVAFELKPSDYKNGSDRLVLTVNDKNGQSYFVNVAIGGGDTYAQIYEIINESGIGVELDIGASRGFSGRTIAEIPVKPKTKAK